MASFNSSTQNSQYSFFETCVQYFSERRRQIDNIRKIVKDIQECENLQANCELVM